MVFSSIGRILSGSLTCKSIGDHESMDGSIIPSFIQLQDPIHQHLHLGYLSNAMGLFLREIDQASPGRTCPVSQGHIITV